jgi:hypothetical protein
MSEISGEQNLLSNKFGAISNKRVIFQSKKGLFSNGYREDIPLKQIVSIRFYKQRFIIGGIAVCLFLTLIGAGFFSGNLLGKLVGLLVLASGAGIAYIGIVGMPTVVITTAGGTVTQASGWPRDKKEAEAFAQVLRNQIIT